MELFLHHFDWSPFAEKVRLILGLKQLQWQSVQIPMIPPKPDLMPLTGGYRKTPVLQIGADVYCDTRLIARELERRFPSPSLFAHGGAGIALALSHWSDTAFFEPGAALSMANAEQVPQAVLADRREFFNFMDFRTLARDVPHLLTQLRANADLVEQQLSDGREYLMGALPGWVDICAYFPLWMARTFVASAGRFLERNPRMEQWEIRMRALGHGDRREVHAATALEVAQAVSPEPGRGVDADDPLQLRAGEPVSVTPADYGRVPVCGELVTLEIHEVAIRREDPRVGEVVTHFPRIGYRVERT